MTSFSEKLMAAYGRNEPIKNKKCFIQGLFTPPLLLRENPTVFVLSESVSHFCTEALRGAIDRCVHASMGGGIRLCLNPCLSGEDRGAERKGARGATRSHAQGRSPEHGEDCEHGAKRSLAAALGAAPPAISNEVSPLGLAFSTRRSRLKEGYLYPV